MEAQKVVRMIIINNSFENAVFRCLGISYLNVQPQQHVLQEEDEDEDNPNDPFPKEDEMPLSDDSDYDENDENNDDQSLWIILFNYIHTSLL